MQRKSYVKIAENILKDNVIAIKEKYQGYKYYIGVVKNNAYHHGFYTVKSLKEGGINYFAVSSLEEAKEVRKYDKETPILSLEPISLTYLEDILDYDVTLTLENLEEAKELSLKNLPKKIKVHLKVDSGMHRLGFMNKENLKEAYDTLKQNENIVLEGIYTHFATSGVTDPYYDKQVVSFLNITSLIDLKEIPIVHLGRSLTLVEHEKLSFATGIRLGIVLYGFNQSRIKDTSFKGKLRMLKLKYLQKKNHCSPTILENDLRVKQAFTLFSEVMSVRPVKKGEVVGYNTYKVEEDGYILTLPIGYADGVTKAFKSVWIKGNFYKIVSDCMDMIMIYSKEKIPLHTEVEIIGPHMSIKMLCGRTHKNAYHLFNDISPRVTYLYEKDGKIKEIKY